MSYKDIRTFFTDRLTEIDSEFQKQDTPFNVQDEVSNTNFDKRFHIFYGNVAGGGAAPRTITDTVNATVKLYFTGLRDNTDRLDDSFDLANLFRINCMKKEKLGNHKFLKRFVCTSFVATPLGNNDNAVLITLSFSIDAMFGVGANLDC
jgi:hypothetical protein